MHLEMGAFFFCYKKIIHGLSIIIKKTPKNSGL
jgi:hypothetical protein